MPEMNPAAILAMQLRGGAPEGGAPPSVPPQGGAPPQPQPQPQAPPPQQPQGLQPMPDLAPGNQSLATGQQMMDLYTGMMQREYMLNGLHRGIATMLAGMSRNPGDRALLLRAGENPIMPSAADQMNNLMRIQQFAIQQQMLQNYWRNLPNTAQYLDMDPKVLATMDPTEVGKMVEERGKLTDKQKELIGYGVPMPGGVGGGVGAAGGAGPSAVGGPTGGASAGPQDHPASGQTVQQPPGTAKNTTDFNDYLFNNPSMIPIVGPNMGLNAEEIQLAQAQVKWAHEHPNQPMSPDFASVGALKNYETVQAELGKDRLDAQTNLQKNIDQTSRGQDAITRLKNNPQLEAALAALRQPWRGGQHLEDMMLSWRATNPQLYEAIRDIQFLGDQTYAESFASTGSKRTQQEVNALKAALSQVNTAHYTRGQDYIEKVLNPLDDTFSSNLASDYGLSGRLDAMPKHLRPYANPIYGPGQPLYGGTGGGWMSKHLNMRGMSDKEAASARKQLEPGDIYFDNDGKLKQVPEAQQ